MSQKCYPVLFLFICVCSLVIPHSKGVLLHLTLPSLSSLELVLARRLDLAAAD
jgi:hypothetical protein